jgi:hypothetical protein
VYILPPSNPKRIEGYRWQSFTPPAASQIPPLPWTSFAPPFSALIRALLPPSSLGGSLSLSQLVVGEFLDQRHSLHVEVEVTPTRLVVVGLTPLGVPLFILEQEAGEIKVKTLGSESLPFNPRLMLSDFQIAYWPIATLRNKFQTFGLTVRQAASQSLREVLAESGEVLVAVTYRNKADKLGDITVEHFDPPYRLQIKTFKTSKPR